MWSIGIDPGKGGGLAVLGADGRVLGAWAMPATDGDLFALLCYCRSDAFRSGLDASGARAVLERVHASPQMGVVSAFTFGRGYGALTMALHAAGIPFDEVTPQTWQKALSCLSKGDKNVTKRRAQQLFPEQKITHATADALLIAEFCRRFQTSLGNPLKGSHGSQDEESRLLEARSEAEAACHREEEARHVRRRQGASARAAL